MANRAELRGFLSVDKHALDECLMEQPQLYADVSEALAMAEAERDALQLAFEETCADLEKAIRTRPLKLGEKLTEGSVKSQLLTLPKIKTLHLGLNEAKKNAKLWRALEKAFEQRAEMLKKLVDLHLRSTYGYALESGVTQSRGAFVERQAEVNRSAARHKRMSK